MSEPKWFVRDDDGLYFAADQTWTDSRSMAPLLDWDQAQDVVSRHGHRGAVVVLASSAPPSEGSGSA
jgi:hypothetical protein